MRLVRGSHIVTRRLFDHDRCYFFQGTDGRIVFAIPYEQDFTLIGTTDVDHHGRPERGDLHRRRARLPPARFASRYFAKPVTADDVVWTYSGVRPLYDDGASSATAATRDYVLDLDDAGPPLLSVFGGKITTYRRLAESALAKLAPFFPAAGERLDGAGAAARAATSRSTARRVARSPASRPATPSSPPYWAGRLVRAYGTEAAEVLGDARDTASLGRDFGGDADRGRGALARRARVRPNGRGHLWRRSKLGLRIPPNGVAALRAFVAELVKTPGALTPAAE